MSGANIQGVEQRKALSDVVGKKNVGTFSVMQQDLVDWDNFKQKLSHPSWIWPKTFQMQLAMDDQ